MARVKRTNLAVENVKPPNSGRKEIRDTQVVGLALRVTSNGSKTWGERYRVGTR